MGQNYISTDLIKGKISERISFLENLIKTIDSHKWSEAGYHIEARHRSDGHYYYYLVSKSDKHKRIYLKKSKWPIAQQILQAEYEMLLKQCALSEIFVLKYIEKQVYAVEEVYKSLTPARKNLVKPLVITDEEFANEWACEDYEGLSFNEDEDSMLVTDSNLRVRSKSELMIATELERYNIPFKYERPLVVAGKRIYPDFTVLNTRTRQVFVWEHFGMVDDPDYQLSMMRKLNRYQSNGYVQGVNFIQTSETKSVPLSTKAIRSIIESLLL